MRKLMALAVLAGLCSSIVVAVAMVIGWWAIVAISGSVLFVGLLIWSMDELLL